MNQRFSSIMHNVRLGYPICGAIRTKRRRGCFALSRGNLNRGGLVFASIILKSLVGEYRSRTLRVCGTLLIRRPRTRLRPRCRGAFFRCLGRLRDGKLRMFMASRSPAVATGSSIGGVSVLRHGRDVVRSFSFSRLSRSSCPGRDGQRLQGFLSAAGTRLFFTGKILLMRNITRTVVVPVLTGGFLARGVSLYGDNVRLIGVKNITFGRFKLLFGGSSREGQLLSGYTVVASDSPGSGKSVSSETRGTGSLRGRGLGMYLTARALRRSLFRRSRHGGTVVQSMCQGVRTRASSLDNSFGISALVGGLGSGGSGTRFTLRLYSELRARMTFSMPSCVGSTVLFVTPSRWGCKCSVVDAAADYYELRQTRGYHRDLSKG